MNSRLLVVACVAMISGLSGCASARVVRSDSASVVVAVPDQTNTWPFRYQDEAQKVAGQYIKDPVFNGSVVRVKVGESITNTQNTDRRDLGGQNNRPKIGEVTSTSSTTSMQDTYEYHLTFVPRAASSPPMPGGQPFNPAGTPGPIQQTGGVQTPPLGSAPRRDNSDPRIPPPINPPGNTLPASFPSAGLPNR
ncbi:hypothetical protein [Zavarzinella formosa]|uniref:hypothetical protein n=1 Tax=Zavarzinella formosa TaxID=360055 RepID=UPI0003699FA2|nr:hypothetical protein [Zavarzinella formosa]